MKCWMTREESEKLAQAAGREDWEREIAIELMTECGLRSDEVPKVTPGDISYSEEGECWFLWVEGKNTEGGEPKMRDAWVPEETERNVSKYVRERGLSEDEPIISVSASSVRRWIKEAAKDLAVETGEEDWGYVSSHDCRRSWATWHLVERPDPVDVRTMMAVGGWSSYDAIEPYLDAPTERRIGRAMA